MGVVNRERKVKAGRLKELWREAKCITAGVRSSCWRSAGGAVFTLTACCDGWSRQIMIDT